MTNNNKNGSKAAPWVAHHKCKEGCGCQHLDPERMGRVLSHIFLNGRIPGDATILEHKVVVGAKLAVPRLNGRNGNISWELSYRGEGVLLDLLPD